jgi:chitinase
MTPTPTGTGGCTSAAWDRTKIYTGGMTASHNNHEWYANWWTQNEEPGVTTSGVWKDLGACTGVTSTPNPTATSTPVVTATPSSTATRTPVVTATPSPTATRTPVATATPTQESGYPAWDANYHTYAVGDRVTYNGRTYACRQSHTSQPGWTPEVVPALWLPL